MKRAFSLFLNKQTLYLFIYLFLKCSDEELDTFKTRGQSPIGDCFYEMVQ